jgi:excisionase family DNA binding protein
MNSAASEILTVREAAVQVGRAPETIRRWVWSGRLAAQKRGNRLVVARKDLQRVAAGAQLPELSAWLEALDSRSAKKATGRARSSADLVLEDRRSRSAGEGRHARS